MNFGLKDIWAHMGPSAIAIASVLILMALTSLALFIERWLVYSRSASSTRKLRGEAMPLMRPLQEEALLRSTLSANASHVGRLWSHGLRAHELNRRASNKLSGVERTRRELERENERLLAELRRGLGWLATVGSLAPFIGLLGTVVGIITAFQGIAREGSGGLSAVSGGISESLIETALGLVVAIPAVLFYNYCAARADGIERGLEEARGELMEALEDAGS